MSLNEPQIYNMSASRIRFPLSIADIESDKTRKDGTRIVKFWGQHYRNGNSNWHGVVRHVVWAVVRDGKVYYGDTRREALKEAGR